MTTKNPGKLKDKPHCNGHVIFDFLFLFFRWGLAMLSRPNLNQRPSCLSLGQSTFVYYRHHHHHHHNSQLISFVKKKLTVRPWILWGDPLCPLTTPVLFCIPESPGWKDQCSLIHLRWGTTISGCPPSAGPDSSSCFTPGFRSSISVLANFLAGSFTAPWCCEKNEESFTCRRTTRGQQHAGDSNMVVQGLPWRIGSWDAKRQYCFLQKKLRRESSFGIDMSINVCWGRWKGMTQRSFRGHLISKP